MAKGSKKKIKVYECFRNLIYLPIYLLQKIASQSDLSFQIEFSTKKGPLGDSGALDALFIHEEESIPIAICDPIQICDPNYYKKREKVLVIGTLIERLAIWAVGCPGVQEGSIARFTHIKERLTKNKTITREDFESLTISYCEKGVTTSNVANWFFPDEDKYKLVKLNDFGETELRSILGISDKSDIVLTNTPWLLHALSHKSKYKGIRKENELQTIPYLLDPHFITFTGIMTRESYLRKNEENKEIISDFLTSLHEVIINIYKDPFAAAAYIWENVKKYEKESIFKLPNQEPNPEVVEYSIWQQIQSSVYPQYITVDWESWKYALSLSGLIKKGEDEKKQWNIFKENVANCYYYDNLARRCFPDYETK